MGFLDKLKGSLKSAKDFFKPEYEKEHPNEWYFTTAGENAFDSASNDPQATRLYFINFFKSLPNLNELSIRHKIDLWYLAEALRCINLIGLKDDFGDSLKAEWQGWPNIIDRTKNVFVDFLYRLNHKIPNAQTLNILLTLCLNNKLDFDGAEAWLLNAEFWDDPDDVCYMTLKEKVKNDYDINAGNLIKIF